jgi:hypothetical protein
VGATPPAKLSAPASDVNAPKNAEAAAAAVVAASSAPANVLTPAAPEGPSAVTAVVVEALKQGDRVECRYWDTPKFYAGRVEGVRVLAGWVEGG